MSSTSQPPLDVGPSRAASGPRVLATALALFAVALALRWTGIDSGMPHIGEPDPYIVQQMDVLRERGLTDRHMAGWKYPHLIGSVAAALPLEVESPPPDAPLEAHLAAASARRLHVRRVAGFMSAFVAPATFLVALRLLGFRWAVLAGLLAATSLLQLCFSWQARPHGPVAGMAAMATWLSIRFAERPTFSRAGAMGLGCALSLATLHTGAAALGPMAAASLLALRSMAGRRRRALAMAALATGVVLAIGAWFYTRAQDGFGVQQAGETFTLEGPEGTGTKVLGASTLSGHPLPDVAFTGEGFPVLARTMVEFDPILGLLALLGVLASIKGVLAPGRLSPAAWCLLAFTAPTFAVLCGYSLSYARFFLLVILPLAVAGAAGCRALARLITVGRLGVVVVTLACAAMFFVGGKFVWLRTQPDTFTAAARVLEREGLLEDVVHGTTVASFPRFVDPAYLPGSRRWEGHPWDRYQLDLEGRTAGVRLQFATMQTMVSILQAPAPVDAARRELGDAAAAIVAISPKRGRPPIAKQWDRLRDSWLGALDGPDWEHLETVTATFGEPTHATGYWVSFRTILFSKRLGPAIAVFRRASTR